MMALSFMSAVKMNVEQKIKLCVNRFHQIITVRRWSNDTIFYVPFKLHPLTRNTKVQLTWDMKSQMELNTFILDNNNKSSDLE